MASTHKPQPDHLIRSAKPAVQPDRVFANDLQIALQERAQQLNQSIQLAKPSSNWSRWSIFGSTFAVGAAAIIAVIMIVPQWLDPTRPINGYIQKGPFISGTAITIQELDERLQPTGTSYQVTTSSDFGDYRLSRGVDANYVEVIAQGYYFNEVSGELSSAPLTLRAIADVSENRVINVNVLTTLMVPRLRHIMIADEMDFATAKKITEQEVLSIFQITENVADFETMNISETGKANGILLATSVLLQGNQSVAELSELLSKLSLAIKKDGQLPSDGPLYKQLQTNAATLNVAEIEDNLDQRFADLRVIATVPEFEGFLGAFQR